MTVGVTRTFVALVAAALAACGGRSSRHQATAEEAGTCEEPLTFADRAVEKAVRSTLSLAPGAPMTRLDAERIGSLFVQGVSSLDGVECLPKLRSLAATEGSISDLTPLSGLLELESINLSNNAVLDLDPLADHTELHYLDLTRNEISDLGPLASIPLIYTIEFDFNGVSSLEPLAGKPMASISGTNNQISDLSPISTMTFNIREISLSNNPISDLSPLAENSQLEVLRFDGTGIEDLSPLGKKHLLWRLNVDDNRIRDLSPISLFPAISAVHARRNLIENLDGVTLPEPSCGAALELVGNPLDDADVSGLCDTGWVIRYGDPAEPGQCNLDCLK